MKKLFYIIILLATAFIIDKINMPNKELVMILNVLGMILSELIDLNKGKP